MHFLLAIILIYFMLAEGARASLNLSGTVLGFYPVRVLPSKTAIAPVNPDFLPRVIDCAQWHSCVFITFYFVVSDAINSVYFILYYS